MPELQEYPLELSSQVLRGRYANVEPSGRKSHGLIMLGYEECAPEYHIDRQSFPFWTLELIAGGYGYFCEVEQRHKVRHGSAFCFGPGQHHEFWNEPERPFRKYFLVSGSERFPKDWAKAELAPGQVVHLGDLAPMVAVLDQMLDEGARSDAQTPEIVAGLNRVLLAQIARHRDTARGEKSRMRKVYDLAMEILQREYRTLHSLADLAARSGYSGEYLCRVFRQYHHDSPYQVLQKRKMSAAWLLLRDSQLRVGAVAQELGYADPLHFSRVFRKVMGCAPSSVRARSASRKA